MKTSETSLTFNRRAALRVLGLAASGLVPALSSAQDAWKPTRPITMVVPFPAGGGSDIAGRLIAQQLSTRLGQAVVVDNKAGASGAIGSELVYRAAPDGYTLLMGGLDAQGMYPHLRRVGFDSTRFVHLGGTAQMGYALMGRADLPAENVAALIALAKGKELTYGSGSTGSSLHVLMELFAREAGIKLLHVPYQGASPALQAIAGGQIDLMPVPIAVAPQYRAKLKSYGTTAAKRVDSIKDIPTLREQGLNVVCESWGALLAPPGTPQSAVQTLSAALHDAVESPEMMKKWAEMGMTPIGLPLPQFAQFYADEYRKWGEVIRVANIRLD